MADLTINKNRTECSTKLNREWKTVLSTSLFSST